MFNLFRKKKEPVLPESMRMRVRQTHAPEKIPEVTSQTDKFNARYSDPFRQQKEHVTLARADPQPHQLNRTKKKERRKTLHSLEELDSFTGN